MMRDRPGSDHETSEPSGARIVARVRQHRPSHTWSALLDRLLGRHSVRRHRPRAPDGQLQQVRECRAADTSGLGGASSRAAGRLWLPRRRYSVRRARARSATHSRCLRSSAARSPSSSARSASCAAISSVSCLLVLLSVSGGASRPTVVSIITPRSHLRPTVPTRLPHSIVYDISITLWQTPEAICGKSHVKFP